MADASIRRAGPAAMATLGMAAALALSLHLLLLGGWQNERARTFEALPFDSDLEEGVIIDYLPATASGELWTLLRDRGPKEATLRCEVGAGGLLTNCRVIGETAEGYGAKALALMKRDPQRLRNWDVGEKDTDYRICFEKCGIP